MYNIIHKEGKCYHRKCGKRLSFDEYINHWCNDCGQIQSTKNEASNFCSQNVECGKGTLGSCYRQNGSWKLCPLEIQKQLKENQ